MDRKKLIKELDKVYSIYIRQTKSQDGIGTCVTCGKQDEWKYMQNGHFYTRGRFPTRWDDDNCHIQCTRCNIFLKGNYIEYTKYMIDSYSREFIDELKRKSLSSAKIPTPEIAELMEKYKAEIE